MSKLKALILTSSGSRHRYFAKKVAEVFDVSEVISESKRNYYTKQREESSAIRSHFKAIGDAEVDFFGGVNDQQEPIRREGEDINSPECVAWAVDQKPDVICLYGTAILREGWLEAFPSRIVNLHLGLSPFYRGSATLFWPFYFKELQYLGTTIHLATATVDAGSVIARVDADIRPGEDYYQITTRLIKDSIDRFPELVAGYLDGRIKAHAQEALASRVCKKADFSEEALLKVLSYVGKGLEAKEIAHIQEKKKCRYSQ